MMDLHKFKRGLEDFADVPVEYLISSENMKRIPNNDLMRMGKRNINKNVQGFNFPLRDSMGFLRKRAPGMEFVGKRSPGKKFMVKKAPGMEFVGKRAPGMEFVGKRAPGMEFVGKRSSTELKFFQNPSTNKAGEERQKRPSLYLLDSLL